mmetsp:Transcript_130/g.383  ORF Transcript_130/g.383 Transcript_130/m.383 type:complete len:400 (-) Transcript_130:39-1238(-)
MNLIVLGGVYLVAGGLGIGIFLWGKPDGNSIFDRLYRLVCVLLPNGIKTVVRKTIGQRAVDFLDWLWEYICYTSNPLVQIFYLCAVVGGYLVFVAYGYPHVPGRLFGAHHKYLGFCNFTLCLGVWWKACRTDPGMVTAENADALSEVYPWDDIMFGKADCRTCNVTKPARSKHCGLCGICVARFDHHCIWINNCVGVGNHKWFLGFLFWHTVLCLYGASLGTLILYDIVESQKLLEAVFVDPVTKERHTATKTIVLQYLLGKEAMVIFVTILAMVMGLVLAGFLLWHLNLVRMGMTTNELSKWNYIVWALKQEGDEGKQRAKELRNVYNKGAVANYKEVLFQIDVHNLPPIDKCQKASREASQEDAPQECNSAVHSNGKNKANGEAKKRQKGQKNVVKD